MKTSTTTTMTTTTFIWCGTRQYTWSQGDRYAVYSSTKLGHIGLASMFIAHDVLLMLRISFFKFRHHPVSPVQPSSAVFILWTFSVLYMRLFTEPTLSGTVNNNISDMQWIQLTSHTHVNTDKPKFICACYLVGFCCEHIGSPISAFFSVGLVPDSLSLMTSSTAYRPASEPFQEQIGHLNKVSVSVSVSCYLVRWCVWSSG